MIVISSIFSSYLIHASTALFSKTSTASCTSFLTKAGTTRFITSSFSMNYHSPSDAITINLWSKFKTNITFLYLKLQYFRLTDYSHSRSHPITKRSRHCQTWNILVFHPHTVRAHLFSIFIVIRSDSSSVHDDSLRFHWILAFVVSWKRLGCPFFVNSAVNDSPWVT